MGQVNDPLTNTDAGLSVWIYLVMYVSTKETEGRSLEPIHRYYK